MCSTEQACHLAGDFKKRESFSTMAVTSETSTVYKKDGLVGHDEF